MQTPHKARHGFTLIELLVVIAIISVLLALFVPTVKEARDAARSAVCMVNLKQVGFGFANYAQMYNDYFLGRGSRAQCWTHKYGEAGAWSQPSWINGIDAYLTAPKTFLGWPHMQCPAETGSAFQSGYTYAEYYHARSSYGINWSVEGIALGLPRKGWSDGPRGDSNDVWDTLGHVGTSRASDAPLVGDIHDDPERSNTSVIPTSIDHTIATSPDGYQRSLYAFRHPNLTMNWLYWDGSVRPKQHKSITGENVLFMLYTPAEQNPPGTAANKVPGWTRYNEQP